MTAELIQYSIYNEIRQLHSTIDALKYTISASFERMAEKGGELPPNYSSEIIHEIEWEAQTLNTVIKDFQEDIKERADYAVHAVDSIVNMYEESKDDMRQGIYDDVTKSRNNIVNAFRFSKLERKAIELLERQSYDELHNYLNNFQEKGGLLRAIWNMGIDSGLWKGERDE